MDARLSRLFTTNCDFIANYNYVRALVCLRQRDHYYRARGNLHKRIILNSARRLLFAIFHRPSTKARRTCAEAERKGKRKEGRKGDKGGKTTEQFSSLCVLVTGGRGKIDGLYALGRCELLNR